MRAPVSSATEASPATGSALPVALHLEGDHSDEVRRWVEGVLGWQPVDPATAGLVPPALRLVDHHDALVAQELPTLLLVAEGTGATDAAVAAARLRPDGVVAWPQDRQRLPQAAAAALARHGGRPSSGRLIRVGGAAGGVGTTTVTLALTALAAWKGARPLAVLSGHVPVASVRTLGGDALRSPDLWDRATALDGVPDARVVRTTVPGGESPHLDRLVLHDVGVADDVDVLVLRADGAGLAAAGDTVAAVLVVVEGGCATPAELRRACGQRRRVEVPWSHRVARAAMDGRVPSALPGTYLRRLAAVAPRPAPS